MKKFFRSSFFILTGIALLSGIVGAFLSGWFDVFPDHPMMRSGFLQFLDGVSMGVTSTCVGLLFYWVFHILIDDYRESWADMKNKSRRVIWGICRAGFLGWAIPTFWLPIVYIT